MESSKLESIRRSRSKKILSPKKLTLSPEQLNPENVEQVPIPNCATISMEIRHQGHSELEMAVTYHNDSSQIHPAYRPKTFSTGPGYSQNYSSPESNYLPPVLPGFHGSPAFRSGSFAEPDISQNYQNVQQFECQGGNKLAQGYLTRPRSSAVTSTRRPNLANINTYNQNIPRNHFDGFEEGYNPNFIDTNIPNYFCLKTPIGNNENRSVQQNECDQQSYAQSGNIFSINIAEVIKKELEIDGTLDFV